MAAGRGGARASRKLWAVMQGQCAGRWVWRAAVEGMVYGVLHRAALPLTAGTAQLARRAQQAAVSSCSLTPPDAEPCSHVCRDLWISLAAAQRFWDCAADDTFSDAFGPQIRDISCLIASIKVNLTRKSSNPDAVSHLASICPMPWDWLRPLPLRPSAAAEAACTRIHCGSCATGVHTQRY